ncbi:MAG: MBL fold metallo-hydrolase [Gemmatimonadota bacterium]|nr:MBL fold metallo-hydrolase [Gemmatimonadota bacterium]
MTFRKPVAVTPIGGGATIVDLRFRNRPAIIGVNVLELDDGVALVDPGPEARMAALRAGLAQTGHSLHEVRAVLLTHIHLDHATAAGAIAREAPAAKVFVHAAGAPHMTDPARLLASAGRIYGDAMGTLWGDFIPVPRTSLKVVDEGDVVALGGRRFQVAYVPGHARHHVAYYEAATGTAWVGDVGGIRIRGGPALPVTPPPDIDVEGWKASMERVMAWTPERIVATHFGPFEDPGAHFAALSAQLDAWAGWVRESLAGGGPRRDDDRERARDFAAWVTEELRARFPADLVDLYRTASGFPDSWWGLARYWRKRAGSR